MKEQVYLLEQFDDIKILRYDVPAFEGLTLREKLFVYYLGRAALAGRDILWDQNNKYNLRVRAALEKILRDYRGDRDAEGFQHFVVYAKKVFFANGIHHHYSMEKFVPGFTSGYFKSLLREVGAEQMYAELERVIFDPEYMAKRVVLDEGKDLVEESANHYYENVTQEEVESYYREKKKENEFVSWGLNSTLVRDGQGQLQEQVWHDGGKYGETIRHVVENLRKASGYACNEHQKEVMDLLIEYYETGDLSLFDRYSIEWVKEVAAPIDFINGFIEVYGDPLAYKASWESVVQIMDEEACERTRKLADNALWFEKNAPIDERFKKSEVVGITARVVQAAMLGGDCHPATPIGINLPNAEWIRERYGSKSVTLDNITYAYDRVSLNSGVLDEFAYSLILVGVHDPLEADQEVLAGQVVLHFAVDIHPVDVIAQVEGPDGRIVVVLPRRSDGGHDLAVAVEAQQAVPQVGDHVGVLSLLGVQHVPALQLAVAALKGDELLQRGGAGGVGGCGTAGRAAGAAVVGLAAAGSQQPSCADHACALEEAAAVELVRLKIDTHGWILPDLWHRWSACAVFSYS